jgi:hypothetical protein
MAEALRVMVEIGPKGKKVAVVAPDWPGLERGAKTEEAAIERLLAYVPRYAAAVVTRAGLEGEFGADPVVEVIERYPGTGSTDFWGISFAFSDIDRSELSTDDLERQLTLMQACWASFDDARSRVSVELRKGPRGGGRDRNQIVSHTFGTEREWAKKLGVATPEGAMLTDDGLRAHREDYCRAIRELHAEGESARTWPLAYLIRHTAYHTMDHAWEMEDKDLTGREKTQA